VSTTTPMDEGERQRRSGSFGEAATTYERFRPGPPPATIDWLLPANATTVVDLGAGTGAMSRDLVARVPRVIAVEPDDRMRGILSANLPQVTALKGVGEAIPLSSGTADAVLASASWHWMDAARALREIERVLVPGGTLGVVWAGIDPDGPFVTQAQVLLSQGTAGSPTDRSGNGSKPDLADAVLDTANRIEPVLRVPAHYPFSEPEHQITTWDVALTADELVGLLGTFSWIITMAPSRREAVFAEALRVLKEALGVVGDVTVDVQFRSEAWRTHLVETLR
jgi:SAM-dependent methyltransferase